MQRLRKRKERRLKVAEEIAELAVIEAGAVVEAGAVEQPAESAAVRAAVLAGVDSAVAEAISRIT
jgi:hypothetical protein